MADTPSDLTADTEDIKHETPPFVKGMALGFANLVVIAIGIVAERNAGAVLIVVLYGGIPILACSGLLGALAGVTARRSPRWRAVLLVLPAFGLVVGLGTFFELPAAIPFACIPTLVAALVLERWTRRIVPPPVASARSVRA